MCIINMGRRIADATSVREDSNYDDEFIVKPEIYGVTN